MLTQSQAPSEPQVEQPAAQPAQSAPIAPAQTSSPETSWLSSVDPEIAKDPSLMSIKDINSLAKSYVHAQKLVGKNKIVVPDEYATPEDWKNVYHKLGLPAEKDKYQVNFGEATGYDEDFKKSFIDHAYDNGVLPKQAEAMFKFWDSQINETNDTHSKEQATKSEEAVKGLQKEWGSGFQAKVETARTALRQFADEGMMKYLEETKLGNDVNLVRLFAKIGESLNEDTFSRETVKHLGMTKDDAQNKINEIMGNMTHPYYNKEHPEHSKAVADMGKYYEALES